MAQQVVDSRQRGFTRGRCMTDIIIELEAVAFSYMTIGKADPGMLFLDFANAFGSLTHGWTHFVLRAMGVPAWV